MSKARHLEPLYNIESYRAEIARGNVSGAAIFGGFGEKTAAGVVTNVDIWTGPTALQPVPASTGIQMEVVSDDVADDLGSTGIEVVEIHYLDAAGDPQTEQVTLDGLTPVNTVATDIRFVQCFHTYQAGSNAAAVGNISLRDTTGATTYKYIPAGGTRCLSSMRMVPRGKSLYVTTLGGSVSSGTGNRRATIRLKSNAMDGQLINGGDIFFPMCTATLQDNSISGTLGPILIPELSILKCELTTDGAASVSANWYGWYEDK